MILPTLSPELTLLYEKKEDLLLKKFFPHGAKQNSTEIYETIISLGKLLPKSDNSIQISKNLVEGCQSVAYLSSTISSDGIIHYEVSSEALISAGLAALLFAIYQDEPASLILHCPPAFIQKLGLHSSLSPGRSNGLASLYSRMKQDAIKLLIYNISN
jgi:cysteine desulfuration protein SufE